ncbi:mitochondrial ribosomal protein MRP51 [Annulohypoxylon maeteangense]|uniref:mitochondrial ribosomal protein MRP51 n=1 Tax=Annulohypoxylon maeteangense TaxID=1927788 RepID=UPI002008E976|nr:mitochondrial ribosomal protein MRP51 [Annulohypoxylon maeteangense]KAI0888867.1 mitochondrial ribosomal protein MRP51 [Annulohypoxylon maeteangense]
MAGRSVSPGAALLRTSRMFSMPPPIPSPTGDYSSATKHYSPSATIPFPTHLAVTTTSSSRLAGDWGFKRPFPLKTTTDTTYPLVRVKKVDSIEQVTDFDSASDHVITLRKYQEMALPVSVPAVSASRYHKSVFEEDSDVTALDDEKKKEMVNKRWKFTGPWLAGMTDGDFSRFLEKTVRGRRIEFRAFLRETLAAEMTTDQAKAAREAGEPEPPKVTASEISEQQLNDFMRVLRVERMTLYNLVSQFLDLAPVDVDVSLRLLGKFMPGSAKEFENGSPYGISGPPITHPSAGISYLRTRSFLENHTLYGPQKHHAPIQARILKPTNLATQNFRPSIGVAGFVANTTNADTAFNAVRGRGTTKFQKQLFGFELEKRGGSKVYVDLSSATIDSFGKIIINVDESSSESEVVQKELAGELAEGESVLEHLVRARERAQERSQIPLNPRSGLSGMNSYNRLQGSASNYGLRS